MSVQCAIRSRRLAGDPQFSDQHVDSCLRCQVEAVRYRTLVRRLAALRDEQLVAPPGLVAVVASRDDSDHGDRWVPGREAVVATAGLAAVVGAIAIWRRAASA